MMEHEEMQSFETLWGDLETAVFSEDWEAAEDIIEKAEKLGYPSGEMQRYIDVHKAEEIDGF